MNNKFLDAYKNLENELRADNTTVLDYENSLKDANMQEKLKLCRITRNYLSHQDTKFIVASKDMIEFINKLTTEIRLKSHIVKDDMKRVKTVYPTETIKNIIPLCAKNIVPIVDKKTEQVIYLVDSDILVANLAKGNKKIEVPKRLPKYQYCKKDDRIDGLKGIYIVTSDGTEKGKYLGILNI